MHSVLRDPRTYVRQEPLPVYIPNGVKVQARSLKVFNPTIPSRNDMRSANIHRRHAQMTSQGFRSVNFKPYQGIGDPFYLDHQQLILHALGQLEENKDLSNRSDAGHDWIDPQTDSYSQRKSKIATKFVLRRDRQGLNTLNKEVKQGRTLVRNVKLGHGLFDLIKQQRLAKRAQAEAERKRKEEAARTDWQPPKFHGSDDETESSDEELGQDVSLNSFMSDTDRADTDDEAFDQSHALESDSPDGKGRVTFSGFENPDSIVTTQSRPVSTRKKKAQELRPYTPQHNSLVEANDLEFCSKSALFRQLCVLYWILESMNMEQPHLMGNVSQSWNLVHIGGTKTHPRKAHDKRLAETKWDNFVNKDPSVHRGVKRASASRSRLTPRRLTLHPRMSIFSTASLSSSVTTPNSSVNVSQGAGAIPEASPMGFSQEVTNSANQADPDEDAAVNTSIFKFLDEYYASLDRDRTAGEGAEPKGEQGAVPREAPPTSALSDRGQLDSRNDRRLKTPRASVVFSSERMDSLRRSQHDNTFRSSDQDGYSTRSMMASRHTIRPKSTPALLEFQASLPSNRLETLPADMKEMFAEIKEDKASEINDTLEQIERNRLKTCQNKFIALSMLANKGETFHNAVKVMRPKKKPAGPQQEQQLRKKSSIHCAWYLELLDSLPPSLKAEWYFEKILDKLKKYGLVEGSGKQSVYKFLNVLKGLRSWEICNPDVSAAIEFCRRNVVEMTVSEFEEWFQQTFPDIERPETAPPALKNEHKGTNSSNSLSKA